jgi:hypothetical protein
MVQQVVPLLLLTAGVWLAWPQSYMVAALKFAEDSQRRGIVVYEVGKYTKSYAVDHSKHRCCCYCCCYFVLWYCCC